MASLSASVIAARVRLFFHTGNPTTTQRKNRGWPVAYRLLRMIASGAIAGMFGMSDAAALPLDGIDHFAVNVHDLKASESWYQKVFGFQILHEWPGVAMVGAGNIKIGLFEQPKATPVANPDNTLEIEHVAFLVDGDKYADVLAAIRAQGISIATGPEDIGIAFSFFIKDPDGNQLEFISYHGPGAVLPK